MTFVVLLVCTARCITGIPATYLLDGEGKIIGNDLRGENLEQAVAKALEKK